MTEQHPERSWHFDQLRRSLRSLAEAGLEQPALFPDFDPGPRTLVRDFDHWASIVRDAYEPELTPTQVEMLAAVEQTLATMSRDEVEFDAESWTETGTGWADVRTRAASALDAFGWTDR